MRHISLSNTTNQNKKLFYFTLRYYVVKWKRYEPHFCYEIIFFSGKSKEMNPCLTLNMNFCLPRKQF